MLDQIKHSIFTQNSGFFPLALKHKDTVFVYCRTGTGHLGLNGKIMMLASSNGTDWEQRGIIAREGSDIRNPSAFIFPNGEMLLAVYRYDVYDKNGFSSPSENKSPNKRDTLIYSSNDSGYTWKEVNADFSRVNNKIGKVSPHGSMFMFDNQLLMAGHSGEGAFLLSSKDKGVTWEIFSKIASDLLEPFVLKTADNKLLAVLRSGRKSKWAEAAVISSFSNGQWIEPAAITEPMQHPANLLLLSDGRILLSYSDRNYNNQRILLKISGDNGCSWSKEIQLGESFNNSDFGYPSTVEIEQGKLLTVFYVNQVENPYFYFGNPDFYTDAHVKGCYYLYSSDFLDRF